MKWTRRSRGSTSRVTSSSLTVMVTCISALPSAGGHPAGGPAGGAGQGPQGPLAGQGAPLNPQVALVILGARLVPNRPAPFSRQSGGGGKALLGWLGTPQGVFGCRRPEMG